MTGVEILSSQPIYNIYLPGWWAAIAFGFFAIALILILCLGDDYPIVSLLLVVIIGIVVLATVLYLSSIDNKNDINYWEHKVIIDDSVSMTEFMKKYEPIEQDGKIWIIKEKIND